MILKIWNYRGVMDSANSSLILSSRRKSYKPLKITGVVEATFLPKCDIKFTLNTPLIFVDFGEVIEIKVFSKTNI